MRRMRRALGHVRGCTQQLRPSSGTVAAYRMEGPAALAGSRAPGTATTHVVTRAEAEHYHREGFLVKRGLFNSEETSALLTVAQSDAVAGRAHGKEDASGVSTKLALWNTCGVNIYGALARSARIVDAVELLLSGPSHGGTSLDSAREEAYHYHTKVMIKEPMEGGEVKGGAWEWHQDYGYWYNNGCLYPKMMSAMLALNHHTLLNGCLRILPGSHHMGRNTHTPTGNQAGADPERIKEVLARFEDVPVECEPGDVLFFHCNLFHASQQNKDPENARWSVISCYNTKSNNPYRAHHHPCYEPLDRWADSALMDLAGIGVHDGDGTVFMNVAEDLSAKETK